MLLGALCLITTVLSDFIFNHNVGCLFFLSSDCGDIKVRIFIKELLGVTPDLRTGTSADELLQFLPVFSEHFKALHEFLFLYSGPSSLCSCTTLLLDGSLFMGERVSQNLILLK